MDINLEQFTEILKYFKEYKYNFINESLKEDIQKNILLLFPNLNKKDFEVLYLFSLSLIEKISNYLYFKPEEKYYRQWSQNNYKDIKGIILILLPFIDDRDNGKLLKEMIDLNQFLYAQSKTEIPLNLLEKNRNDFLKSDFKFSNISLGLLYRDKSNLLSLYNNDLKIIYTLIHHNYIGLLKTLEIMNGKYYINWINIVPLTLENYKESEIYKKTKDGLDLFYNLLRLAPDVSSILNNYTDSIQDFFNDYYGLWFGDLYNVIRNKIYQDIKPIKFLIFTFRKDSNKYYLINYLNEIININNFFKYESYEDLMIEEQNIFEKSIKNESKKINNDNLFEIWKQIFYFLCNSYSNRLMVKKENKNLF